MNENLNNIYNETNEITFNKIKGSKISQDIAKPLKLIKTNRAECQHIKDDDNFNIEDFIVDDFFNNEKAIKLMIKMIKKIYLILLNRMNLILIY